MHDGTAVWLPLMVSPRSLHVIKQPHQPILSPRPLVWSSFSFNVHQRMQPSQAFWWNKTSSRGQTWPHWCNSSFSNHPMHKYSTDCMRRSVTRIRMMNQITVVRRHMTAAMLRKSSTKLEAIPHCLKVKQQTGWKQRRRGCPNKQGSLRKREPSACRAAMPSA